MRAEPATQPSSTFSPPVGPVAVVAGPLVTLDARDPEGRCALHWLADQLDRQGWTPTGRRLRAVAAAYAE